MAEAARTREPQVDAISFGDGELRYWQQPGALNEHIADVFGTLVSSRGGGSAEQADWLIGAGLFTDQGEVPTVSPPNRAGSRTGDRAGR
jgi:Zn-dependent metalloprotease